MYREHTINTQDTIWNRRLRQYEEFEAADIYNSLLGFSPTIQDDTILKEYKKTIHNFDNVQGSGGTNRMV